MRILICYNICINPKTDTGEHTFLLITNYSKLSLLLGDALSHNFHSVTTKILYKEILLDVVHRHKENIADLAQTKKVILLQVVYCNIWYPYIWSLL